MTFGHHGVFSLTPILLVAFYGLQDRFRQRPVPRVAILTAALTLFLFAFHVWNPKVRNYGGLTQGFRWLFWLYPLWLLFLPRALAALAREGRLVRGAVYLMLLISIFSAAYALREPWSQPWL